jgi:hypothetical protein
MHTPERKELRRKGKKNAVPEGTAFRDEKFMNQEKEIA